MRVKKKEKEIILMQWEGLGGGWLLFFVLVREMMKKTRTIYT